MKTEQIIETAYKEGRTFLLEHEALQVFEAVGVKFPENTLAKDFNRR